MYFVVLLHKCYSSSYCKLDIIDIDICYIGNIFVFCPVYMSEKNNNHMSSLRHQIDILQMSSRNSMVNVYRKIVYRREIPFFLFQYYEKVMENRT